MATTEQNLLSPEQLYNMSASQQQAYLAGLSSEERAAEQSKLNAYKQTLDRANMTYLKRSVDKYAVCPVNGGGTSATYAAGTTLSYTFPTAGGAYLREIEITADIKFTPATGTSATYQWTAAGAYAWFQEIDIIYNGQQARIRPYFLKVLEMLRYKQWLANGQVLSGLNAVTDISNNVSVYQPSLTGGSAAISKFKFRIPLQLLRWSPVGMLPMQGQGTKGQINIQCATTLGASNADPLLSPINYNTGSGFGITLDSTEKTVQVNAIYNDGTNLASKTPLSLNMAHLPTAQYIMEQPLNNLTASTVNRQRIATLQPHYVVASVIIDGNQSTSFALTSNINSLELDQDSAGQNKFFYYGSANNTSVYDYYSKMRHLYGQDLDQGVVIWTDANQFGTIDPDAQNGDAVLDMSSGKWTDVNYGVQVGSVSSSNFTPRVETYLFSRNDAGLVLA